VSGSNQATGSNLSESPTRPACRWARSGQSVPHGSFLDGRLLVGIPDADRRLGAANARAIVYDGPLPDLTQAVIVSNEDGSGASELVTGWKQAGVRGRQSGPRSG
jgi:hypothetical protein